MTMSQLGGRTKILVTAGVALALLLAALDQTIVGTAMPRIIADLNGFDKYAWVTTAYLVTATVMTPISGKLGDLFGRKPFLLAGMIGFMVLSWACGASQDMNQLVVFRGTQGLFGGMLFASVFTVIADIFPPEQRARAQGVFGAVFGLSSVFGPTAGGWITDNLGWRWVFFVNVPVGVLAVTFIAIWLPFIRSSARLRDIDFWGALTMAAGLTPILIGLSLTRDHEWNDPLVLGLIGVGLVLMAVFVVVEHYEPEPIVPLKLFLNRAYTVGTAVGVLSSFGMFGSIIFVPLIFQGVMGQKATNSGALITPMMFGLIGASMVAGQLMVRIKRYHYLGTLGMLVSLAGMYFLSQVSVHSTAAQVTASLVMVGIGLGVSFPLYITAVQSAVDRKYLGVVSSNTQFWRNVGGTIATAVFGSVLAAQLPNNIRTEVTKLNLPPQALQALAKFGNANPQQIFNNTNGIPAPILDAIRTGLAVTIDHMFLIGLVPIALAVFVTLLMPDVPLKKTQEAMLGEAPPVPLEAEAQAEAV
jgi:EmrB/QacA subfamily drug resistance transporter